MKSTNSSRIIIDIFILLRTQMTTDLMLEMNMSMWPMLMPKPSLSFTSSIQLGYISTAWKLATLRMLLKPYKLPSPTTSSRPISLISSIMKLFERVIEQRLRSHLEHIGFLNKHQSGFRKAKSTDDHLFRLSQSIMESFN